MMNAVHSHRICLISGLGVGVLRGVMRGIEWCSVWSQCAVRDKRDATSLTRNLVRFEIGWEWFYGKLLLNHSAVCSFIRSHAGVCKMIHDVSLFLKPRLQLSGTCCFIFLLRVHDSALREKILLTHFSFYNFFSHFFFCFLWLNLAWQREQHIQVLVLLINIPLRLAVKIINLISLRWELDVSLITARNIKQIKAQSLALHHREEWRSREFRKLNCWEHSVIYLPHYPGDATFSLFSLEKHVWN